jgi:hypothetical protein
VEYAVTVPIPTSGQMLIDPAAAPQQSVTVQQKATK